MNRTAHFWPFRELPYDAQGNRVLKEETGAGGVVSKRTWYVRDAAGQHLTTYEQSGGSGTPRAKEYLLYGSSRLGTAYADNAHGGAPVSGALYRRVVGQKQYEVGDHLGNVRATVGDIKVRSGSTFAARVESYTEYFPFGMVASTATVAGGVGGRFGFNGMEKDNEVKGEGNHVDFGARWYDSRVGRWGSVDKMFSEYADVSTYNFALNTPIYAKDPDGNVVIFVNGMHFGDGGTSNYWAGFDQAAMAAIGDHNARYVDGAMGGGVPLLVAMYLNSQAGPLYSPFPVSLSMADRMEEGRKIAKQSFYSIVSRMQEGETIKIVTHSMGSAFARGYIEGLQEALAQDVILGGSARLSVEYILDVNPWQGQSIPQAYGFPIRHQKKGGYDGDLNIHGGMPGVGLIPTSLDITTAEERTAAHSISDMNTRNIPFLGNGGVNRVSIEQRSNNINIPPSLLQGPIISQDNTNAISPGPTNRAPSIPIWRMPFPSQSSTSETTP